MTNARSTASVLLFLLARSSIRESLAFDALKHVNSALHILYPKTAAVVVAKGKLIHVAEQLFGADVLVKTTKAALQNAEVTLDRIGGRVRRARIRRRNG